jgi:cell division septum initiation protein DivIVA
MTPIENAYDQKCRENERLLEELAQLKAELSSIGKALNDPRLDLSHTAVEIITELKALPSQESVGEVVEQDTTHHGWARAIRQYNVTTKDDLLPVGTKIFITPKPSAEAENALKLAREALDDFVGLIAFQYTGSREAMSALQEATWNADRALDVIDAAMSKGEK